MGLIDLGKGVQPELEPGVSPVRAATLPTEEFSTRAEVFKQDLQVFYRITMIFSCESWKSCKSCQKNHYSSRGKSKSGGRSTVMVLSPSGEITSDATTDPTSTIATKASEIFIGMCNPTAPTSIFRPIKLRTMARPNRR